MDELPKKIEKKKNRIWWVHVLLVAIIAYGFGLISAKNNIFPYSQIKEIIIAGLNQQSRTYHFDKESFFEYNGSKADIVMIGASIIDNAEWHELFPNVSIVNRGIGGDTTKDVLNRMESIISTNPKKAFLMIGINDLGEDISVKKILSNYDKIVSQLKQHGITPYIQSVLLLGPKHAYKNKDVLKLNLRLRELSEKENIIFIDLNKVLSKNGTLIKSFSSEDEIHLNGLGYSVWKNSIKKYIQ